MRWDAVTWRHLGYVWTAWKGCFIQYCNVKVHAVSFLDEVEVAVVDLVVVGPKMDWKLTPCSGFTSEVLPARV